MNCITDEKNPRISYVLESDQTDVYIREAKIKVGSWETRTDRQIGICYEGEPLQPFTTYTVEVEVHTQDGDQAYAKNTFRTGKMGTEWNAEWISDEAYAFENGTSPVPFVFRKTFACKKQIKRAFVIATAWGIYELAVDGKKAGEEYFAPGFTSYAHHLQYSLYEIKDLKQEMHEITAVVGGGWAAGRSTYIYDTNKSFSKISAELPAFLMELHLEYADGSEEIIGTDESWQVTQESAYRFGDFYDGEIYDASINASDIPWHPVTLFKSKEHPKLTARYGDPVTAHEVLKPVEWHRDTEGRLIYNFGQNLAGVVRMTINGKRGQIIRIRHGEVLENGALYTESLRSAKQLVQYTCAEGRQTYSPRLTYMGFQYIEVSGIEEADIEKIEAVAVYSDMGEIGQFVCSDEDINRLQSNVVWSGKSNFVDIPTDCPQRDERQGWTGDIALFASTACFNFDMNRFLEKWLLDLKDEQTKTGSVPYVVPKRGNKTPIMTTSCWGDSCIMVPWALYLSRGDKELLRRQYPGMQRYMHSVRRWVFVSNMFKKSRLTWSKPFQFGDWCAPYGSLPDWFAKGPWVGTAYFAHISEIMSKVSGILGETEEQKKYEKQYRDVCREYEHVYMDGKGKLLQEFQTGYVLPLYFGVGNQENRKSMADHLWKLIMENDMHLNTGFPSTPYILFALSDNGRQEEAYRLLKQDTAPSWVYNIRKGGTTFWEQWDTIQPDGSLKSASMNHYAYGAVGDFFYRRICGLEAVEGGYKRFSVKPLIGGGLTWAECSHVCPYGTIRVRWEIGHTAEGEKDFEITVDVPVNTACELTLPDGEKFEFGSGKHTYRCRLVQTETGCDKK